MSAADRPPLKPTAKLSAFVFLAGVALVVLFGFFPALRTLPELLRRRLADSACDPDDIPGVITSRNCRDARLRTSVGAERPINERVLPDYTAFRSAFDNYRSLADCDDNPTLFLETSRGCWWGQRMHCTFCGLNGSGMVYRSAEANTALALFEI